MRVGELAEALDWDRSRVSHQLTRMEKRGFVWRSRYGADGRRAGIGLTVEGRRAARSPIDAHIANVRRHALDSLAAEQAAAIRAWSEKLAEHIEPGSEDISGQSA